LLGSFKIGSVLGITVRVHWLFLALLLFVILWPAQVAGAQLVFLGMLFGVVFLHELGHSLVARRFGLRVYDITFWPLGGMARMSEIPESSRVEMWIALAGPAVNFVLAALAAPLALWGLFAGGVEASSALVRGATVLGGGFVWINLALGVFNLVPAFPMDGGRVLRAFLGRRGDWVAATERAVRVGRAFAIGMIAVGLVFAGEGLLFLPLIGLFVWFSGARELWAVRARHGRMPFGPLAGQPFPGAPASAWSAPPPPPPHAAPPPAPPPRDDGGARRPGAPLVADDGQAQAGRRLTAEDIERLERFQGPLRQFRPDA
jgi:Zn-dependent protease